MNAGLYIHIPFCHSKCRYCDFYSITGCREDAMAAYCAALKKEIALRSEEWDAYTFDTLFIGGGTPSLLPIDLLEDVLKAMHEHLKISFEECTIESNPGTLSKDKLKAYRDLGINRLSMGLQAKQDHLLKGIGRMHTYQDFLDAYDMARAAGFDNINVDLMSGLPGQSREDLLDSIQSLAALDVEHISLYTLKLEEGTPLYDDVSTGRITLMDSDEEWVMSSAAREMLATVGYHRYEISNYAKAGKQCLHNLNTWRYKPYLGLGAAAASKMPGKRWENVKDIKGYRSLLVRGELPVAHSESLGLSDCAFEALMLGLRLVEGIDLAGYQDQFNLDILMHFRTAIKVFLNQGLVKITNGRLALSERGMDMQNAILVDLLERWPQRL